MKIKKEKLAERCEICHQKDYFDAIEEKCLRCKQVVKGKEKRVKIEKVLDSILSLGVAIGIPFLLTLIAELGRIGIPSFSLCWFISPIIVGLMINRNSPLYGAITNFFLIMWVLFWESFALFQYQYIPLKDSIFFILDKEIFSDPIDFIIPSIVVMAIGLGTGFLSFIAKIFLADFILRTAKKV